MNQVVILSPDEKDDFIQRFNRTIEMGSLSPIEPHSTKPAVFLRQVTTDKLARILIPLGFGLWFALLVIVSIIIPGRSAISLGYDANGSAIGGCAGGAHVNASHSRYPALPCQPYRRRLHLPQRCNPACLLFVVGWGSIGAFFVNPGNHPFSSVIIRGF